MKQKLFHGLSQVFSGSKDVIIVLVYCFELLALLFAWDWFISLTMHQSVINTIPGAALLAYLAYVACEWGFIAFKNWVEKPSILNVLFSVIKVPVGYYLFVRLYLLVRNPTKND